MTSAPYFVGNYRYNNNQFIRGGFAELDNGHDFYETQTTLTPDGRRVVVGWMNMWESPMPESADGWAGALTLPRELVYKDNILQMKPIKELEQLRTSELVNENIDVDNREQIISNVKQYEALLTFSANDLNGTGIEILDSSNNKVLDLKYLNNKIILNRTGEDEEREAQINLEDKLTLHLYVDTSSVEIFVNDGVRTFTERFYADNANLNVIAKNSTNVSAVIYKLENSAIKF